MSRRAAGRLLALALVALGACGAQQKHSLQEERARLAVRPDAAREYAWVRFVMGEGTAALEQARAAGQADYRTLLGLGLRAHEQNAVGTARDLWTAILERAAAGPSGRGGRDDPWAPAIAELAAHRLLSLSTEAPGTQQQERAYADRALSLWRHGDRLPAEALQLLGAFVGQVLRLQGREEDARAVDDQRGCPAALRVAGPLGSLPRLDLLTPFGPDDPDRDRDRARYALHPAHGCELTLDGAAGRGRPGVMYAVTWVEPQHQGRLPLTLETSGQQWALYVDGRLVYRDEEPLRRRPLWLELPAGRHALALKVAVPGGRVAVQMALPGVRYFSEPSGAGPAEGAQLADAVELRALSPLPRARTAGEEVLRGLLLGQQGYITGDVDAGMAAVSAAQAQAPRWASLWILQAGLAADDPSRPRTVVRDRVRRALEQVLVLDPGALRARLNLALMEQQEDRPEQALNLLDAAPKDAATGLHWQEPLLRYRVYKARSWLHEAEQALAEARRRGPAACSPLEALRELRVEYKDQRGVLEASRLLAACNPYSEEYAGDLVSTGDLPGAEREYRRLLALEPDSEGLQQGLAEVLAAQGGARTAEAIGLLRGLVARYERSASHRLKLANLLIAQGQRAEAVAVVRAGVEAVPESGELQRAQLALGGTGLLDEHRVDGKRVVAEFQADPVPGDVHDAVVIVLDRTVMRVFPSGARLTLTHNIIKVLSKDGAEKFGEVQVPDGADVLTLRTIKADGTTREPEEISGKEAVSAPDLEVGDYVEFEYVERQEPAAGLALSGGFISERFYFASPEAPLYRTEYVLVTPRGMSLQIDRRGDAPQQQLRQAGQDEVRLWARQRVQRVLPESPQADGLAAEWLPSVRAGAGLTFERWRDFLRERMAGALRPNRELRELAMAEGAGDGSTEGLLARAQRLDSWVRRNIKQGGSLDEEATMVLSRREGSRVVLLAALLRAAGIPFELGLGKPALSARLDGPLPDTEAYTQPVLAVAPGRGPGGAPLMWIDPHYRHAPTGSVRPGLRGARVLAVLDPAGAYAQRGAAVFRTLGHDSDGTGGAGGDHGTAAPGLRDRRKVELTMTLAADGSGEVAARETLTGWPALEWREELEKLDDSQVRKALEQRSLGFFFPGAALDDLKYGPLDDDRAPLVVEYRFHAPQLSRPRRASGDAQAQAELVLPVPYPALLSKRYVGVPRRQTPLVLQYVVPTELEAEVRLPAGAAVVGPLQQVQDDSFGRFRQKGEVRGGLLHLHEEFFMPEARVEPARYPALRAFAERVDAAEDRAAVISLPR